MQTHDRVRTPTDVGDEDDREWLVVRPTDTADVEIEETDDGPTEITVPISSTTPHRSGSRMSESALESMAAQLGEATVGLWDDHGLDEYGWPEYRREDMYGWWVDGEVEDGVLYGTARLREGDERSADLVDQLDQGMPVGFSVGYIPLDEEWVEADDGDLEGEEERVIHETDLLETSPVGIPDNPRAYADAPARVIARSIADAGVASDLDRQSAEMVGDRVADALQTTMGDGQTASDEAGSDGGAGDGADGTEEGTTDTDPEQKQYSEEEVQEIIDVIGENIQSALESAADDLLNGDDDDEDEEAEGEDGEDDEDEESEGDHPDDDDDDDDEENTADVEERLDELQAENEELRAKVDRLESETRDSQGRKGMAAPTETGDGDVDEAGDADDESGSSDADTTPGNALDEAALLGGD